MVAGLEKRSRVLGDKEKDYVRNVERYARLGIPEYFIFDPPKQRLLGYRLGAGGSSYEPILPQSGYWRSDVLDLELSLDLSDADAPRLQFSQPGGGTLLDPVEWVDKLRSRVDGATRRAEEEARRAEEEVRRVEEQRQRIERLEARLRELGQDPDEL